MSDNEKGGEMNTAQAIGGETSYADKEAALIERFDKNLTDYHASLEGFTARELIGMADRIAATNRIHTYMTQEHGMDDGEIDFLLQFQNPLEVIADEWHDHGDDTEGMDSVVYDVCYQQNVPPDYPLMSDLPPFHEFAGDEGQRRFTLT